MTEAQKTFRAWIFRQLANLEMSKDVDATITDLGDGYIILDVKYIEEK